MESLFVNFNRKGTRQIKEASLKVTWVKKAMDIEKNESPPTWMYVANQMLKIPFEHIIKCNIKTKDIGRIISISSDGAVVSVLKAWAKINYKELVLQHEILEQFLTYNSSMHKNGAPFLLCR